MKKAKVILTTFIVLAAVGGALAFKAKTFGNTVFCSSVKAGTCNPFQNSTYAANSQGISFCTTSSVANKCTIQSDAPVVNE